MTLTGRLHAGFLARWNETLSINKLPIEILVFIMKLAIGDPVVYYPVITNGIEGEPGIGRVDTSRLFRLAHVCRRWYYAALSTGTLWSIIDGWNLEQLDAFIQRAGNTPL